MDSLLSDAELKILLRTIKTIAVVGASATLQKPSHYVPAYLKEHGYTVIPINPRSAAANERILGEKTLSAITEIEGSVDCILIFRPSSEALQIVKDSLFCKPRVVWMQEGITDPVAAERAIKNGSKVVMDTCIMKECQRLFG